MIVYLFATGILVSIPSFFSSHLKCLYSDLLTLFLSPVHSHAAHIFLLLLLKSYQFCPVLSFCSFFTGMPCFLLPQVMTGGSPIRGHTYQLAQGYTNTCGCKRTQINMDNRHGSNCCWRKASHSCSEWITTFQAFLVKSW